MYPLFSAWTTVTNNLYRVVGNQQSPLTDKNISRLFEYKRIGDISMPNQPYKDLEAVIEITHNKVHRWVGGEMFDIETAGQDPMFYIYHSFIDLVYEDFRAHQRANGIDPETDWEEYYGQTRHHPYAPMGLGNLMTFDGTNEIFAENIQYASRPTCSKQDTDCKSVYLYCNVTAEKCVPWTIKEYKHIKRLAEAKFLPFEIEANAAIEEKIAMGFEELYQPPPTPPPPQEEMISTEIIAVVDSHNDDHSHSHEESDDKDYMHEIEDNTHIHEHHSEAGLDVIPTWREYTLLTIFAVLLAFRIIFCIFTKCVSENRKRRQGTCKKYAMDGIVNQNYHVEDNGKVNESDGFTNRSDIYTVTVTCDDSSTLGSSTYVRFSRYIIGEKSKDNRNKRKSIELLRVDNVGKAAESNYDIVENNIEKIKELEYKAVDDNEMGNAGYKNGNNIWGKELSKDECQRNGPARAVAGTGGLPDNDYMDMSYASKVQEEEAAHRPDDIFEKESDTGELPSKTEDEERLNSVENENFDLRIADTVNSFAFLDDYDNVYFVKESMESDASRESLGDSSKDTAVSIDDKECGSTDNVKYVDSVEHM